MQWPCGSYTAQNMKFSIKDFFSKCDQSTVSWRYEIVNPVFFFIHFLNYEIGGLVKIAVMSSLTEWLYCLDFLGNGFWITEYHVSDFPVGIYLFKVSNGSTKTMFFYSKFLWFFFLQLNTFELEQVNIEWEKA